MLVSILLAHLNLKLSSFRRPPKPISPYTSNNCLNGNYTTCETIRGFIGSEGGVAVLAKFRTILINPQREQWSNFCGQLTHLQELLHVFHYSIC